MQVKPKLVLREIALSQGKSARTGSVLSEGDIPEGTSIEDKVVPAEIIWSGDGGALRKSSIAIKPKKVRTLFEQIIDRERSQWILP